MVNLSDLANNLNNALNAYSIVFKNGKYLFRIILDTANYKKPSRMANEVVYYIHGILNQTGSLIENTSTGNQNGTLATRLDLAVPIRNKEDVDGNLELASTVREILDTFFSQSTSGTMEDSNNNSYTFGMEYSFAASGERRQLPLIGDCFTYTVYINYYFTQSGINSKSFQISIDGTQIPFTKFGIRRDSTMEGNVPSGSTSGGAQNVIAATVLSINFDMPAQSGNVYDIISDYILNGASNVAHLVQITYNETTTSYVMAFADAALNLETVLTGNITVSLAEALTANNVYTYSSAASAYLEAQNADV